MVMDGNCIYHGEHFIMCTIVKSLCCTPENNMSAIRGITFFKCTEVRFQDFYGLPADSDWLLAYQLLELSLLEHCWKSCALYEFWIQWDRKIQLWNQPLPQFIMTKWTKLNDLGGNFLHFSLSLSLYIYSRKQFVN